MSFSIITFITVFLSSLILDILWAFCIRRISTGKAFQAASFSFFITFVSGFITLEFVGNRWYLIPAAIGAFVGNYLTVKFDAKPKKKRLVLTKKVV